MKSRRGAKVQRRYWNEEEEERQTYIEVEKERENGESRNGWWEEYCLQLYDSWRTQTFTIINPYISPGSVSSLNSRSM